MQYCGGKHRISKKIIEAISPFRQEGQVWVEPFVGSGSVLSRVEGLRLGSDIDEGLISLLVAVRDGYVPPEEVDEATYKLVKESPEDFASPFVNFVRFACSFGGKSWRGFARNKRGDNYARAGSRSLVEKGKRLQGVDLVSCSYSDLILPERSFVYCDPPYKGTYNFDREFDSSAFFQWCRVKSEEGCSVFISEYEAPEDFKLIWEKEVRVTVAKDSNLRTRVEKVFQAPVWENTCWCGWKSKKRSGETKKTKETNVDYPRKLNHLSLCAGYGGIDLGLSRTIRGLRTVSYVEIEAFAIENLAAKVEKGWLDPAPIYSDLKTFPFKEFCGCIDLLSGGFPCQPFSAAGRKGGDEDPRHLFPYILGGARAARIPILFLENVAGIISSKLKTDRWNDPIGTPVLLHVLRELERAGYGCAWGVFSAEEIGAPRQRKRVFILAVSNQLSTDGLNAVSCRINDELGDSQHDGQPSPKECGGHKKDGEWDTEGKIRPLQSEGASRPVHNTNLQRNEGGELAYPLSHTARAALGDIDKQGRHSLGRHRESVQTERDTPECGSYSMLTVSGETAYPRGRGGEQYSWEAPRVTRGEIEPQMGRAVDGSAGGMGNAELFNACDNRTDELRLLGNGVIPDTAARAFRTLWRELVNTKDRAKGREC